VKAKILDGDRIRRAVSVANVPVLLMVIYQVTGDPRWLDEPYRPTRGKGLGDHDTGGLSDETQSEIRDAAIAAIMHLQSGNQPAITAPSADLTVRMMSVCMGEEVAQEYGPMLSAELARLLGERPDDESVRPVSAPRGFHVLVVGAGVAGIAAAHELESMGLAYTIIEKQSASGGVWLQNTYPGAGVDTPSHLYSFSFAKNDWKMHFEMQSEIRSYLERVLTEIGAKDHVKFSTEVIAATYDEHDRLWRVEVRSDERGTEILTFNVIITAVGILNRAKLPDIKGMGRFTGPSFHSSDWPEGLELKNKRVGVIGTGASSMQIVPSIAEQVESIVVFQRSPQWVAPFEKFHQPISEELRLLIRLCPQYHGWYWLRLFWQFGDKVIEALRKDPSWPYPERAVNARNDGHREFFTRYLQDRLAGRPDLVDKVLPDYPPFGKRILLDNGWYEAVQRNNVALVNDSVVEVRERSVVAGSGKEFGLDVLVWATGFDASRFVASLEVHGIDGRSLREVWNEDDPRAYMGLSVPGFPNLFLLAGPNSLPGSGSVIFFIEVQMRYVRRLLTKMLAGGIAAIDARDDANRAYNDRVDRLHEETVWTHPGMRTYYRNSHGRVVVIMPFRGVEYWNMTNVVNLDDYTFR
jgi:4-hydroxyacetophenone monooxygenase